MPVKKTTKPVAKKAVKPVLKTPAIQKSNKIEPILASIGANGLEYGGTDVLFAKIQELIRTVNETNGYN